MIDWLTFPFLLTAKLFLSASMFKGLPARDMAISPGFAFLRCAGVIGSLHRYRDTTHPNSARKEKLTFYHDTMTTFNISDKTVF